jgi:hypothetical protein
MPTGTAATMSVTSGLGHQLGLRAVWVGDSIVALVALPGDRGPDVRRTAPSDP